jgi:hypothetical protein
MVVASNATAKILSMFFPPWLGTGTLTEQTSEPDEAIAHGRANFDALRKFLVRRRIEFEIVERVVGAGSSGAVRRNPPSLYHGGKGRRPPA